jgi:ABC-2 type transport system permease protein
MIGGSLRTISYALPFVHAIDAARAALSGDFGAIMPHLWRCSAMRSCSSHLR